MTWITNTGQQCAYTDQDYFLLLLLLDVCLLQYFGKIEEDSNAIDARHSD